MYGIELLVTEHDNILRFVSAIRKISKDILEGKELNTEIFKDILNFGRNYADKHHHQKEEDILFKYMLEQPDDLVQTLVKYGMIADHQLGRMHAMNLKKAVKDYELSPNLDSKLDIIVNAVSYGNLLVRHIDKENRVAYVYAEKILPEEVKTIINKESKDFELASEKEHFQEKYLALLEKIENF